jgi:hypothetical protein
VLHLAVGLVMDIELLEALFPACILEIGVLLRSMVS